MRHTPEGSSLGSLILGGGGTKSLIPDISSGLITAPLSATLVAVAVADALTARAGWLVSRLLLK